jgi:hypothetical protein
VIVAKRSSAVNYQSQGRLNMRKPLIAIVIATIVTIVTGAQVGDAAAQQG